MCTMIFGIKVRRNLQRITIKLMFGMPRYIPITRIISGVLFIYIFLIFFSWKLFAFSMKNFEKDCVC